jgi:hypothetical protein
LFFWLKLYDVKCQNYQINIFIVTKSCIWKCLLLCLNDPTIFCWFFIDFIWICNIS